MMNKQIECVNIENGLVGRNPKIDLSKISEIFRSTVEKGSIYIRFVEKRPNVIKRKIDNIDTYWIFDNFEEQMHNYKLVLQEFNKL